MAFLDKLKRRVETIDQERFNSEEGGEQKSKKEVSTEASYAQLDVDIYETPNKYYVITPIAGVDVKTVDISIGEENDVLIIQGKKRSPIEKIEETEKNLVQHHQECQWGDFYRQIILPQEVNPEKIEAYEERGMLVISLPLLRLEKGKRSIQIKLKDWE
jgi:HSP20 family protein